MSTGTGGRDLQRARPPASLPSWATDLHGLAKNGRLLPARPDLAAAFLEGVVGADRFVEGRRHRVAASLADLKRVPRHDAALDTQLLHGEVVQVYDDQEGWAWVQAERDGYVGYVSSEALVEPGPAATHQVSVARTFVYPAADMKRPVLRALPLAAQVTVEGERGAFVRLEGGGFLWRDHLHPLDGAASDDVVTTAESLVGSPYLWGGRTGGGLDCSALVQLSFGMAGVPLPRDASMQEEHGHALPFERSSLALRRGDLVFWPGHVAVMCDAETLVHASGHQMLVCKERLQVVRDRIAGGDTPKQISAIKRRT